MTIQNLTYKALDCHALLATAKEHWIFKTLIHQRFTHIKSKDLHFVSLICYFLSSLRKAKKKVVFNEFK